MAVSVGAVYTAQLAYLGREAVSSVGRTRAASVFGTDNVKLPDGLGTDAFSQTRISLSTADAKNHLTFAVAAGNAILDALNSLQSLAELADHRSLVSPSTALLTGSGTRVSQLNIDAQAKIIIDRIDALVATTQVRSANLISSSFGNARIQTSRYGGSISVLPQPLDSTGLGIANLDFLTDSGIDTAKSAIENARAVAGTRVGRLKSLHSALSGNDLFADGITAIIANSNSSVLPRGSVVNVTA